MNKILRPTVSFAAPSISLGCTVPVGLLRQFLTIAFPVREREGDRKMVLPSFLPSFSFTLRVVYVFVTGRSLRINPNEFLFFFLLVLCLCC